MSGYNNSSFLQIPSGQPQTPRTSGNGGGRVRVTPSFSFGLGFSPSFNFSSPRNMGLINSLSPQRFFQVSNNLSKAVEGGRKEEESRGEKENTRPKDADGGKGGAAGAADGSSAAGGNNDIFNSLTPPDSSRTSNKFLDSLTFSLQNKPESTADDTVNTQTDSIDVWSSMENENNHNISTLTSIYEDTEGDKENTNAFLTPNKLLLNVPTSGSKLIAAPKLKVLKSKVSEPVLPRPSKESHPLADLPKKKRRLASTSMNESPNRSIASKIDSYIQTPDRRKSTCSDASDSGDRVWWQELDEALMKCFMKYRSFRENQSFDSSALKNTSQNKVLSRMVFSRTGVIRSAKQVSSRLFRLSKQGRLSKDKLNTDSEGDVTDHLNDIIRTPLESIISISQSDSSKDNEMIDKELYHLLSSPPFQSSKSFESSSKSTESTNGSNKSGIFRPREFVFKFISFENGKSHIFSSFGNASDISMTDSAIKRKLRGDSGIITNEIISNNVPVIIINNRVNLDIGNSIFQNTANGGYHKLTKTFDGRFESFMKIDILTNDDKGLGMINWLCSTKVFTGDNLLFENIIVTNGYFRDSRYEMHVPFLKDFWTGYMSFLKNGSDERSLDELSIVQIFYQNVEGKKEISSKSKIHGCMIHEFERSDSEGRSDISIVEPFDVANDDVDDNETVIADSSPFKVVTSPRSERNFISPENKLKIDTVKANKFEMGTGPSSAPIYNSTAVQQFNQNILRQQQMRSQSQVNISNQLPVSDNFASQTPIGVQEHGNVQSMSHPNQINVNHFRSGLVTGPNLEVPGISPRIPNNAYAQQTPMSFETSTPARHNSIVSHHSTESFPNAGNNVPLQQPNIMINNRSFSQIDQNVQRSQVAMHTPMNTLVQPHQMPLGLSLQQQATLLSMQPKTGFSMPYQPYNTTDNNSFDNHGYYFNPQALAGYQMGQPVAKDSVKENNNQKNIKFGPILEYDPSKDPNNSSTSKAPKPSKNGLHRFPINTQIMYKPKKR